MRFAALPKLSLGLALMAPWSSVLAQRTGAVGAMGVCQGQDQLLVESVARLSPAEGLLRERPSVILRGDEYWLTGLTAASLVQVYDLQGGLKRQFSVASEIELTHLRFGAPSSAGLVIWDETGLIMEIDTLGSVLRHLKFPGAIYGGATALDSDYVLVQGRSVTTRGFGHPVHVISWGGASSSMGGSDEPYRRGQIHREMGEAVRVDHETFAYVSIADPTIYRGTRSEGLTTLVDLDAPWIQEWTKFVPVGKDARQASPQITHLALTDTLVWMTTLVEDAGVETAGPHEEDDFVEQNLDAFYDTFVSLHSLVSGECLGAQRLDTFARQVGGQTVWYRGVWPIGGKPFVDVITPRGN